MDNNPYKDRITNKIKNAFLMGVNERYFIFLDELGLKYGLHEESCIKARNTFTHGDNGQDDVETLQKTQTFFVLFGRVILQLLGYQGEYIDITVSGYPRKEIGDKIGA